MRARLAGDNLNLTDSCSVNVTSAELVSNTYVLSFTIGPLTPDQRDRLAISGQPVALFGDGVLAEIELGGTLNAESCFSPVSVSASLLVQPKKCPILNYCHDVCMLYMLCCCAHGGHLLVVWCQGECLGTASHASCPHGGPPSARSCNATNNVASAVQSIPRSRASAATASAR